jgi:hypothetical protein
MALSDPLQKKQAVNLEVEAIRFQAQVTKVQTIVDGGWRLTLDLGVISSETLIALSNAKSPGIILECACIAVKHDKTKDNLESDINWH